MCRGKFGAAGGPEQNRYSSLAQINRANVKRLELAWTYDSGETGGLRARRGHRQTHRNVLVPAAASACEKTSTATRPRPPTLVTVRREGRLLDAVAQTTKHGYVFVFDRTNGVPLFLG